MKYVYFLQINNTPVANDPLDSIIVAAILLFILSTITEKFTTLVRLYPGQFRFIGFLFNLFFYFQIFNGIFNEPLLGWITGIILFLFNTLLLLVIWANTIEPGTAKFKFTRLLSGNLSVFNNVSKQKPAASKENEEREVTALSFMIGLIVAFLFNANLFNFFDTANTPGLKPGSPFANPPYAIYALDPDFFKISFVKIIGFLLTAFFLCFGAKFFHDLLDNLLQVKNLKRKLNDKADLDFNDIKEFDQFMLSQEKPIFEEFLNKQLNQPGVFFESNFDKRSVVVHMSAPNITIPDKLFYKTTLGKVLDITIIKKVAPAIKTLSIPLFPSSQMANKIPLNNALKGTLGYFVKAIGSTNVFLLTCYHVVWNGHDWDHFRPIGREKVVHPLHGQDIGEIYVALKNSAVDAVLIKAENVSLHGVIEGIGEIGQDRALNPGDVNLTVRMRGNTSSNREGFIAELNKSTYIRYPDGTDKLLENLVLIKTKDGRPFSQEGDSGALVVDSFGFAIAMIVAGDGATLSLAIPFSTLKSQLNIEIHKTT